jgi:hypothetical protein
MTARQEHSGMTARQERSGMTARQEHLGMTAPCSSFPHAPGGNPAFSAFDAPRCGGEKPGSPTRALGDDGPTRALGDDGPTRALGDDGPRALGVGLAVVGWLGPLLLRPERAIYVSLGQRPRKRDHRDLSPEGAGYGRFSNGWPLCARDQRQSCGCGVDLDIDRPFRAGDSFARRPGALPQANVVCPVGAKGAVWRGGCRRSVVSALGRTARCGEGRGFRCRLGRVGRWIPANDGAGFAVRRGLVDFRFTGMTVGGFEPVLLRIVATQATIVAS